MAQIRDFDWSYGPMGPGWFILLDASQLVEVPDPIAAAGRLTGIPTQGPTFQRFTEIEQNKKRDVELALTLLLR